MKRFYLIYLVVAMFATLFISTPASSQSISSSIRTEIAEMLTRIVSREVLGGDVSVNRVRASGDRLTIYASVGLSYYPFRDDNVQAIYDSVRLLLPSRYANYKLLIITDNHRIEEFVPGFYSSSKKGVRFTNSSPSNKPLVTPLSSINAPSEGLTGRHIAMWQSHGRYFEQEENIWRWQRSRLWETVEDLFTQSFVLPYLVPMLESAGANVLLPRERDTQLNEIIIDNDEGIDESRYTEQNGSESWQSGGVGFAHKREVYGDGQNPFREGTTRFIETSTSGDAVAQWRASIPEDGRYAVYVSYESFGKDSAEDATYTIHHRGGESRFAVNQTMGGGMWIYLGHFDFRQGDEQLLVSLSNRSSQQGKKISADAVKIGGGYGNVARSVGADLQQEDIYYEAMTSEYPRFCEGARYWLQWSGFDEEVYTPKENKDDYRDDYMSRSHWVNCLMGGSARLPDEEGKGVPIDMVLAFHSDAGVRLNDDIIGTLGIFYTKDNRGRFEGGADRYLSRELTDVVMTQIVEDIRSTVEPAWSRRGMWNRSYYEARVPSAPTMLLELMSHQNFADMRYGNDPRFKFLVSRAVYKGILRYLSSQYGVAYTVQPLPVESFSVTFADDKSSDVVLRWSGVEDSLEPSAKADYYIVYTRKDDGAFDNGVRVDDITVRMSQERGHTYSYRVTAVNKGGESFPSEILSAHRAESERGRILVVNGFDRVSAPLSIQGDSIAGFYNNIDSGVAYIEDISFTGEQRNYDRRLSREGNDNYALGSSYSDYDTQVLAGNTFDYAVLHGHSIVEAGFSYCSSSADAVELGQVRMEEYPIVDLILGKQRSTMMGRGTSGVDFEVFPEALQARLKGYTSSGGGLFASGCYVASDLWNGFEADSEDRDFAHNVLHIAYNGDMSSRRGLARVVASPMAMPRQNISFNQELSSDCYAVESSGSLLPHGKEAFIAMRYVENNQVAAVCYRGKDYRSMVMAFPFETILDQKERHSLMRGILDFITAKEE